jgi:hypothetical protein
MAFIVVILAIALGVIWEFAEWGSDIIFGTYEQWGYTDTIKDLFVDMIAGIIMAALGLTLIRRGNFTQLTEGIGQGIGPYLQLRKP